VRIKTLGSGKLSRVFCGVCYRIEVGSVPLKTGEKCAKPYCLFAQGLLTESSMFLKRFNIVNRFFTALYGKLDSESHSHINNRVSHTFPPVFNGTTKR